MDVRIQWQFTIEPRSFTAQCCTYQGHGLFWKVRCEINVSVTEEYPGYTYEVAFNGGVLTRPNVQVDSL